MMRRRLASTGQDKVRRHIRAGALLYGCTAAPNCAAHLARVASRVASHESSAGVSQPSSQHPGVALGRHVARSPSRACAAEANSWDGQSQPWASMGVVRLAPVLCQCAAHPCAEPPATPSCRRLPNPTQLTSPAPAEPVPRSCSVPHSGLQPRVSGTPAEVSPTGPRCSEFREAEL